MGSEDRRGRGGDRDNWNRKRGIKQLNVHCLHTIKGRVDKKMIFHKNVVQCIQDPSSKLIGHKF